MNTQNDILIKGMVCQRCKIALQEEITRHGFSVESISLGRITLAMPLDDQQNEMVRGLVAGLGFEMISDRQTRVVNKVKEIIARMFDASQQYESRQRFSQLFSEQLNMNYDSISEIFNQLEGMTLEKYVINKRIEKVKELLVYTDFTLTQIAYITGFNSINHLSRQFKELCGFPPSHFRSIKSAKSSTANRSI